MSEDAPARWGRHSFYMSDEMAAAARVLAAAEQRRTRSPQFGSGQIVERAMRRYVAEVLTPHELAALLNGHHSPSPASHTKEGA